MNLDDVLADSLGSFATGIVDSGWIGKEREAISLFVMDQLIVRCRPGNALYDPRQIGIEVRVPQLPAPGRKAAVCKDLAVWPRPKMTCFDQQWRPVHAPLAIMEWKASAANYCAHDVEWLTEFTRAYPECTGFAVCLNLPPAHVTIRCARIARAEVKLDWFCG